MKLTGVFAGSGGTRMWKSTLLRDRIARDAVSTFSISPAAQTRPATGHGPLTVARVHARRPRLNTTDSTSARRGAEGCTPKKSAPRGNEAAAHTNIANGKCEDSDARPITHLGSGVARGTARLRRRAVAQYVLHSPSRTCTARARAQIKPIHRMNGHGSWTSRSVG